MATTKITERVILNSILDGTADPDVLVEYAEKRLAQLDKRNESAAKRAAKKRAEGDALSETIYGLLGEEPLNREQIVEKLAEMEIETTPSKVTARMTNLCKEGKVAKTKMKVTGEDGKSREVTGYILA